MSIGDDARVRRARFRHDRFNAICVSPLAGLALASLVLSPAPWVDLALSLGILGYTAADTVYNGIVPEIQPSRQRLATILLHHAATCWLALFPIAHPDLAYLTGYAAIVEVNTVVLTLGKLGWKSPVQQALFYLSWISMRLVWYPYYLYLVDGVVRSHGHEFGSYGYCQSAGMVAVLTGLNYFWTLEIAYQQLAGKRARKPKSLTS